MYLDDIRAYANAVRGAQYVIDGFRMCPHLTAGVIDVDRVMYSSYRHWYIFMDIECWIPVDHSDQWPDWSSMKNYYGSKFASTWIGGHDDLPTCDGCGDQPGEIPLLIGHATNLGLSEIWLYCANGTAPGRLESFTYQAWESGWLRRFEREYFIWWRCNFPDPCANCDPDSPEGWVFDFYDYTGNIREVYP